MHRHFTVLMLSLLSWPSSQSFQSAFCSQVTFDGIGFPLISQILSVTVINIVLFGNLVQSIDAWITMF